MALTKESMAAKIIAAQAAVTAVQVTDGNIDDYRIRQLEAFCQGLIDEFVTNAIITTTAGAPDGEHTGKIE